MVLPRTHAPMAILQLNPTLIMEEATSQLETAQASAILQRLEISASVTASQNNNDRIPVGDV